MRLKSPAEAPLAIAVNRVIGAGSIERPTGLVGDRAPAVRIRVFIDE